MMKTSISVVKVFLLLGFLTGLGLCGWGQGSRYPVQVNVNLLPPYSLYLSDYVSGSRERLSVTLLNRDVQYQSMPVKLRLTVKGNGFTLQSRSYASVPQMTLEPNVPYKLTLDDLRPYFEMRNLSAGGLGGDSYLKGGRLPEGMVEFGIEVLEYTTSKVLSQRAVATAWLVLQKPPLLTQPSHEEVIPWREPLNLLFQWTPQHSAVGRVEYELIVRELWDNGLAPESAFAYSPEIFRERITSTGYLYGALAPSLEQGRRYAWAVRVVAKDGADDVSIFENDGMSMVRSFRLARYCPEPVEVKAGAERGYINVEWAGAPEHTGYTVSYRLKGTEEWTEVRSHFPSAMLTGVRPGHTYEYRVGGYCEENMPVYGVVGRLTLPSEDTSRLRKCGILPAVDISNQEPLLELESGDRFLAGDFPVHIQKVSGSQGYFTGVGYVHIPYFAFAPFQVTFDNIYINTDRRMIRGVVKTVYDPSEGGITDLDDIFTGGSNTGHVVEGITQAGVSADFVIETEDDFSFDESTGQITVTDGKGQVIGYIDTGSSGGEDAEVGKNSGSSVFPLTVEDKEGNIYRVEEAPAADSDASAPGDMPSPDTKKKLVVIPVGKSGSRLSGDEVNFKRLDTDVATVVFTDTEGSIYAFDEWEEVYSRSMHMRSKYEQLGQDYYVPSKLLPPGKTDRVGAVLRVKAGSVDPEKVIFKTSTGTEFQYDSYDKSVGRYTLSIVGGKTNDACELYALYPKPGGGYYNLGKLLVVSYPSYELRVKVVPVSEDLEEFDALRRRMQEIYARVGIDCRVEKMPVFDYDAPLIFKEKTGMFSAYNDEMKQLNRAYEEQYGIDEKASYLFILSKSGQGRDRNYSGFMPLNKQFGYLFRDDFKRFDDFAVAAAHELAHGRLSLRHPFDKSLGLTEGDLPGNLMDYSNGTHLAKWQWDVIHDPGVIIRIFERDQDAQKNIEKGAGSMIDLTGKEYAYLLPTGKAIKVKGIRKGRFNYHGHLIQFILDNGSNYLALYMSDGPMDRFYGYVKDIDSLKYKGKLAAEVRGMLEKDRFKAYEQASLGQPVFARAKSYVTTNNAYQYTDCICDYIWSNESTVSEDIGISREFIIPKSATRENCTGKDCDIENRNLEDGFGSRLYVALKDEAANQNLQDSLLELCNYLSSEIRKSGNNFAFYTEELRSTIAEKDYIRHFKDKSLFTLSSFHRYFRHTFSTIDYSVVFSTEDLWKDIDKSRYNVNSRDWVHYKSKEELRPYAYNLSDLSARWYYMTHWSALSQAILNFEKSGNAQAISSSNAYKQYVALWGTDAAFYAWADYTSSVAEEPLLAYSFYRLVSCSSVEEVHVLLREMSQESLRKIPQWVLKYLGKDVAQKFLQGALMEATMYYVVSELTPGPIHKEDFVFDVLIAGLRNVLPFSKQDQMILACIQGVDINILDDILNDILNNNSTNVNNYKILILQCLIPAIFEYYLHDSSGKLYATVQRSGYSKISKFLTKIGLKDPVQVLSVYSKLGSHNQKWLDDMISIVSTVSGKQTFKLLEELGFDISRLSAKNFSRLSELIGRYGISENLRVLLKGKLDINRMILYMEKTGSDFNQFQKSLQAIVDNKMFDKTITIKGKTMNLSQFVNEYSDEVVSYYYKKEGNKHYFIKYYDEIKTGVEIVVDDVTKIVLDGGSRIILNEISTDLKKYEKSK